MNVMIPVRPDGSVEPRFGKAPMVAVAQVDNDGHVTDWHTFRLSGTASIMRALKVVTTPASFASCVSTTS
ncbi:hypothetical protein TIA1EST31_05017 [Cutibacterium acnes FZ1/2/0]|nr:hypothetical protein HMPREF9569_01979 [Cutibacterium acnes HL078PA1]EMF64278.1 hypothetical protein TIA1EST31_05017 [Cutibacterium acnes FZ1/2/0]